MKSAVRRALLPAGVFLVGVAAHFAYRGFFPERDPGQARWESIDGPTGGSWLRTYWETGGLWLGYSYAASLAFAAWALRRSREDRLCGGGTLALGSLTLSGALAVGGCYLLGCCGSPMLVVYLNLFGAGFLPFAGPLVAFLTTLSLVLSAWWMVHRRRVAAGRAATADCGNTCACEDPAGRTA